MEGTATHAYAVSFIVTNIPTHDNQDKGQTVVDVEAWFRRRTDIENRIREAKLGAGLRHLPSGHQTVNTVWMWAALLAGNLSVLLQALTRIDDNGRAHAARLRHELLCVPARLIRHGRTLRSCSAGSANSTQRPNQPPVPVPTTKNKEPRRPGDTGQSDMQHRTCTRQTPPSHSPAQDSPSTCGSRV